MAAPKIVHGARARVSIDNSTNGGKTGTVGIFNSFSYQAGYGLQPAFILGRFTAAELMYTHADPVSWQGSAWRVVDHGVHADMGFPTVQQLLNHDYLTIEVIDRVTEKVICSIKQVRPATKGEGYANRQPTEAQISGMGIIVDDESGPNSEVPGSTTLPGA